ncbi:hypothetical protein KC734_10995 [candidate division KSB1 bacterium]|nr:hypothetical protein [candidate division KSB1 bacterium]
MNNLSSHAKLEKRFRIQGSLVLKTALHLGGGNVPARGTDSPILRDGFDRPYLPGSSLKGALRAAVERIAPNLKATACGLFLEDAEQETNTIKCMTPQKKGGLGDVYRELEKALGQPYDTHRAKLTTLINGQADMPETKTIQEEHLLMALAANLCDACKAFGSPFMASPVYFHDAPVNEDSWIGLTQVRDGVGIDRDSGRAVDRIKYDYEIVPPDTVFDFSLTVESGDGKTLGLVALALHELKNGNIPLGGIRTRGLGRCDLQNATVQYIDFNDLKSYLLDNTWKEMSIDEFITKHIEVLLS